MKLGGIAQVIFRSQGEAMTQAKHLAESGQMQRPYVCMIRKATFVDQRFLGMWHVASLTPMTILHARVRMIDREG